MLLGDPYEEAGELLAFFHGQCCTQCLLMIPGHAPDRLHRLSSLVREVEGITTTIARMILPLHETSLLEFVDHRHQPAREHSQLSAEVLLAQSLARINESQEARMVWREIERREPLRKSGGRMGADLCEQKRGRGRATRSNGPIGYLEC